MVVTTETADLLAVVERLQPLIEQHAAWARGREATVAGRLPGIVRRRLVQHVRTAEVRGAGASDPRGHVGMGGGRPHRLGDGVESVHESSVHRPGGVSP
jgi:hypothetical protein